MGVTTKERREQMSMIEVKKGVFKEQANYTQPERFKINCPSCNPEGKEKHNVELTIIHFNKIHMVCTHCGFNEIL
jgi:hypothetical protein